jgi:hypothetical protein
VARLLGLLLGVSVVMASMPAQAAQPRARRPAPTSEQGTKRGELEFALAGVMLGVGVGLAAYGGVELDRTRAHQRFCAQGFGSEGLDSCQLDPPGLGYAAVGLSWAFAVPLVIGSGLLFARGARIHADAKRYARTSLAPWWSRGGAGLLVALRF